MPNRLARHLRKTATDEERILWSHLRKRRLEATRFRRQHTLGSYIVDFVDLEHRLIIEVDGIQHDEPQQALRDDERTQWLNSIGYRVIRFTNAEVRYHLHSVVDMIWAAIEEQNAHSRLVAHPHPGPPPSMGRERKTRGIGAS